jgi:hypothetical protein
MADPVAAALDAILALVAAPPDKNGVRVGTAAGLEGVTVYDGPPLADVEMGDALALGLSIEDISAAQGDETPTWGGTRDESHDVTGLIQSASGDVDLSTQRARAYELLAALRAVLIANRDLGGVCDWARLIRSTYRPIQGLDGSLALIEFTVRVDARRFEGV